MQQSTKGLQQPSQETASQVVARTLPTTRQHRRADCSAAVSLPPSGSAYRGGIHDCSVLVVSRLCHHHFPSVEDDTAFALTEAIRRLRGRRPCRCWNDWSGDRIWATLGGASNGKPLRCNFRDKPDYKSASYVSGARGGFGMGRRWPIAWSCRTRSWSSGGQQGGPAPAGVAARRQSAGPKELFVDIKYGALGRRPSEQRLTDDSGLTTKTFTTPEQLHAELFCSVEGSASCRLRGHIRWAGVERPGAEPPFYWAGGPKSARITAFWWTTVVRALHGMGGIGKTALVIEYAHRYSADYDVIWWVPQNVEDRPPYIDQSTADRTVIVIILRWESTSC